MKPDTLIEIEKLINEYDLVLVIDESDKYTYENWFDCIKSSKAFKNTDKKVLILSSNDCEDMISLFYTYEFTDKLRVIGRSNQYGSLLNLVNLGLITKDDYIESMLN